MQTVLILDWTISISLCSVGQTVESQSYSKRFQALMINKFLHQVMTFLQVVCRNSTQLFS
jgi:hypothetical protein